MQEAFIRAYEKLDTYAYNRSFSAWLYKIAYHHCMNLLRSRSRGALLTRLLAPLRENRAEEDGWNALRNKEIGEQSYRALKRLSGEERALIALRVMQGRPYEEIAESLPYSPQLLRKKAERAKKKLRRIWNELEGEENGAARGIGGAAR